MLNALYIIEYIINVYTKNKIRNAQKKNKKSEDTAMHKSHKIEFAEKVVFRHTFQNINGRCFPVLWEIISRSIT